jgi:Fe2+ transport system protein B
VFFYFCLSEQLAKCPSVDKLAAELEVLKAEHDSLQEFLKESSEKETREKKELEEKHAQANAELADKLNKSNTRIKTLVAKAKTYETEAEDIDKLIFRKDFLLYFGFFILILPLSRRKLIVLFHSVSRIRMDQRGCSQQDRGL